MTYSYSFEGQDLILNSIFRDVSGPGYYIDIGCNHPVDENNTYSLYKKGWSGICVDMNGVFETEFNLLRPRDKFLEAAVSSESNKFVTTYINENSRLSTCSDAVATHYRNHLIHRSNSIATASVKTVSLSDLFAQNVPVGEWHLLAIDVEGYESEVLSTLSICQKYPMCVLVEIKDLSLSAGFHGCSMPDLLYDIGYRPIAKTPLDTFFIHLPQLPSWIPKSLIND